MIVHIDIETRSSADLPACGAYRYGCDPSTQVLMAAVSEAAHDAPVYLWVNQLFRDAGVESDPEALELLAQATEVRAFNAPFEQPVLEGTKFVPAVPLEAWRCTQAMARMAGLPDSLEKAGNALGIDAKKDAKGKALIRLFSIPREDGQFNEPRDHREKWAQFCEYCRQDVRAEKEIHRMLRARFDLRGGLLETYLFTQRMNAEGIPVNHAALRNASAIVAEVTASASGEFKALTGLKITQRAKVLDWLRARGAEIEDMQAGTLEALDTSRLPDPLGRVIDLYRQLSYAATKKIDTMLEWSMPDARMRGVMKFYGAGTGRWSAGGPQIQNAKKATPEMRPIAKPAYRYVCNGGTAKGLDAVYGDPVEVLASCIRHFIQLPGSEMLDADYNAIEARVICWLAGQKDALEMWAKGVDQYRRMASLIYSVAPAAVNGDQRGLRLRDGLRQVPVDLRAVRGGVRCRSGRARRVDVPRRSPRHHRVLAQTQSGRDERGEEPRQPSRLVSRRGDRGMSVLVFHAAVGPHFGLPRPADRHRSSVWRATHLLGSVADVSAGWAH